VDFGRRGLGVLKVGGAAVDIVFLRQSVIISWSSVSSAGCQLM